MSLSTRARLYSAAAKVKAHLTRPRPLNFVFSCAAVVISSFRLYMSHLSAVRGIQLHKVIRAGIAATSRAHSLRYANRAALPRAICASL